MCFYIHKKYPKALTAENDIECYKVLNNSNTSIHMHFKYKLNKLYQTRFLLNPVALIGSGVKKGVGYLEFGKIIENGFHSFESRNKAYRDRISYTPYGISMFKTVTCIIPKGAKYYYNPDKEEYVSNKIIIKGI